MKVIIDSAEKDDKDRVWRIAIREVLEEGDELREGYRMVDGKREPFMEFVGHEREVLIVRPIETLAWRAAEYGIPREDINTLLDIMVVEGYITREWWHEGVNLWTASTIAEARERYLGEIARLKWSLRLSTRQAGKKPHPADPIRVETDLHPADLALKSMQVILHRHREGVQTQDPHVAQALVNMERALAVDPNTDNSVASEGYSR
jgi:hypothetical protein